MADENPKTPANPIPAGNGSRVTDMLIEEEMKESYLRYAMSVIVARALPDVRDGLKPSQRRVLVAMNDLNLGPRAKHRKCAKITGDTSGNYHPHGDAVIYPTLVRLAQHFNMRYQLVDPQGNFGSTDGDPPAAMRYTEARMTQAAVDMMEGLEEETVDFIPNFDETRFEPTVLPGKFPNLLVNGAQGIAVGMATSIPPHNVGEVGRAIIRLLENPDVTIDELMQDVKGPDFPTYGVIAGRGGILQAYKTGRGKIILRARVKVEESAKRNKSQIVVTEIPYQVNKAELVKKIADLVREDRIESISDIRDESGKDDPVRIVIELKSGEDPQVCLNQLFKHTNLQTTFSIIMIALVDGRPETLNLKQLLEAYRDHRTEVIRRRTRFLLARAEERKHIVEGLRIAVDHIDEVIRMIRAAQAPEEASQKLQERFGLSAVQADHILRMQLRALTGLERQKLEEEYKQLLDTIADLRDILARRERVTAIIRADVDETLKRYGDERRSEISGEVVDFADEDLIPEQVMVVTVSHEGYVKTTPLTAYRAQGRGGKGIQGGATKEGDFMSALFVANTHDSLLFFTNLGRVYSLKVYEIPEMSRTSRGRALVNVIPLQENERVTSYIPVRSFDDRGLVMVTERGTIKKTPLSAFASILKKGIIAINLDEGDRLIDVRPARSEQEIFIGTRNGRAIRFKGGNVRPMGRAARGVRGIRLRDDDRVVGMAVREAGATLFTVCEYGYGKRTDFEEYRETARGGIGVINIKTSERNGKVVGILPVTDEDEIILISQQGQIVRTRTSDMRTIGRNTQGVKVMGLETSDRLVALSRCPKEEVSEEEEKKAREEAPPAARLERLSDEASEKEGREGEEE